MKYHYTYIVTNLINGKQYVGDHSTDDLDDNYLGSGRPLFGNAKKKYGRENFERKILEFFDTKQEAFDAQEKYIRLHETHVSQGGYNMNWKGGWTYLSIEMKEKISKALKGKKHSEETKRKISKSHMGLRPSEETRKKLSESHKGIKLSKESKEKLSKLNSGENHPFFGKKHSKETKQKIRENFKGKTYEEMYGKEEAQRRKEKMRQSMLAKNK